MSIFVTRVPRTPVPPPATLRAGASRVDLTPRVGVGLAGHGPGSNAAQGHAGRLFAALLLLEDVNGVRVLLIAADLHAGSRWLNEELGRRLADVGLSTDRIYLCASHEHRGPASFYGNHTFDRMTGPAWLDHWNAHFDLPTATHLVDQLEAGARAILGPAQRTADCVTLRPAQLALTGPRLWGWGINRTPGGLDGMLGVPPPSTYLWSDPPPLTSAQKRALAVRFNGSPAPPWIGTDPTNAPPFEPGDLDAPAARTVDTNRPAETHSTAQFGTVEDALRDFLRGHPVQPLLDLIRVTLGKKRPMEPSTLDPCLVDARLHTLVAREPGGDLIGLLGWLSSTPSLVGGKHAVFCSDAFGHATRVLRQTVAVPAGIAGGALGDSNLTPRGWTIQQIKDRRGSLDEGRAMVRAVGDAIGAAFLHAATATTGFRDDLTFTTRFRDLPTDTVDTFAYTSSAALSGSELSTSVLNVLGEGRRSHVRYDTVQAPKARFAHYEAPPGFFPLRRLDVTSGDGPWWTLATLPTEVSTALGSDIQARLGGGSHPVTLSSPAGEFAGYAGTPWEYLAQGYEGGSAYWGMWLGWHLLEAVDTGLSTAQPVGTVVMSGNPTALPLRVGSGARKPNAIVGDVKLYSSTLNRLRQKGSPEMERTIEDGQEVLRASFDGAVPAGPLADGVLVEVIDVAGLPLTLPSGLPLTDASGDAVVFVKKKAHRVRVLVEVRVPGPPVARILRLRVAGALTTDGNPRILG